MAKLTDYNEIICQAIDTIVQQRISQIKFDETILCIIIDNKLKEQGRYTVQYGSMVFEAYGENTTYNIGTQVYILVPKGDYTQKKIIISKYI